MCKEAITDNVYPQINDAITLAKDRCAALPVGSPERDVFIHLHDRLVGVQCWFRTQRNVAGWIEGVHGYIEAEDDETKAACRALTREIVLDEKANAKALLQHVETAETEWMLTSDVGETTFIYGDNMADLLRRKIALMEGREEDEPYVDPDFMWRVPGLNCPRE
jgi:hypothetical protein